MTLAEALVCVWQQVLAKGKKTVELEGESYRIGRTRSRKLPTVDFTFAGNQITGIEQNPETGSRWAVLARQGKRILQFSCGGRYFANVCDGRLTRYPAWKDLDLPD